MPGINKVMNFICHAFFISIMIESINRIQLQGYEVGTLGIYRRDHCVKLVFHVFCSEYVWKPSPDFDIACKLKPC